MAQRICRLDDIDDPGAKGFDLQDADGIKPAFVVRRGPGVWAYVNICPHAGNRLNWKPDAFLTRDRSTIICSAHGANFEIETGRCIGGPCPGRELSRVPASVEDGWVMVGAGSG